MTSEVNSKFSRPFLYFIISLIKLITNYLVCLVSVKYFSITKNYHKGFINTRSSKSSKMIKRQMNFIAAR